MPNVLGKSLGVLRASARLLLLALSVTTLGPVLHGVHDDDCPGRRTLFHFNGQLVLAPSTWRQPSSAPPLAWRAA